MALWSRLASSKLRCLSYQCRRWYSLPLAIAGAPPLGRVVGRSSLLAPEVPTHFRISMRSFAAPAQFKKPTAESHDGPRLNEAITAPQIRLILDEGHCILSTRDALTRAKKLNLDLVEVQRKADPPVCKIMDFYKEKYKQSEKEKERAKSKSAVTLRSSENKEVRFKAKTEPKDLKMKAEMVIRLMERGYRVKCTAMPTGKEDENLGSLLKRLLTLIEDVSLVESGPHLDTKHAYVIVRHVKFAPKKSAKKVSQIMDAVGKGALNTSEIKSSASQNEVSFDAKEEGMPIDDEADHDDSYEQIENTQNVTGWSGFSASDDFKDVFDIESTRDVVKTDSTASMGGTAAPIGKSPAIKAGLGPLKTKLESREKSVNPSPGITALKSGPPAAESNRYSKPSMQERFQARPTRNDRDSRSQLDPKQRFQPQPTRNERDLRGQPDPKQRFQPQPARNERDLRGQLDPKQRQAHPNFPSSSAPSSPAPKFGKFLLTKTPGHGDQGSLGGATTVKSNDRSLPSQSDGVYSGPRVGASATPSFGIFSAKKSGASDNQVNSGNGTSSKSGKADPSSPRYGIFSASKTASSR